MLIIVEGMDRTGKTTLTEDLAEKHALTRWHFSKPEQHPLDEYGRPLEPGHDHLVIDRYHVGETVWPTIFKRETQYDDPMHLWIELLIESRGGVLVKTRRTWRDGELEEAYRDEPAAAEDYVRADRMFKQTIARSFVPSYHWELGQDYDFLPTAWRRSQRAETQLAVNPRWVGFPEPSALLVGDQVGPSSRGWTLPFVPYRGTSGHFLMRELINPVFRHGLRPAIVNSLSPDGDLEDLGSLWEVLGRPPLIPLGNQAEGRIRAAGLLSHASRLKVPHPQYVRRFLRANGAGWYGSLILDAAQEAA